jgi:hypothetical protein
MKKIASLALVLSLGAIGAAQAATDVGVSIGIHQPGVYGRIDIGNYPQPALVYAQPMVIAPSPVAVYQRPVYLYVPPGHQQNWGRYCGQYRACGQPVYFVREDWVRARYQDEHRNWHGHDRGRGDDRGDDRGEGRGNGHGNGRGHDKH